MIKMRQSGFHTLFPEQMEDRIRMIEQGYEGIYQIASFHPDYCFADSDVDDPANYTNRAPYPIFHLLREQSMESALAHFNHSYAVETMWW
jgi:hypothetical protein